jgi:hypothetical protein
MARPAGERGYGAADVGLLVRREIHDGIERPLREEGLELGRLPVGVEALDAIAERVGRRAAVKQGHAGAGRD